MWFEEAPNVISWAARGLSALKELGVEVVTGIVPIEEEEKKLKKKDKKSHRKRDKEVKDEAPPA